MQLINDLSDINRFSSLLNPYYKQKLISDINELLVKYMDEQSKSQNAATPNNAQIGGFNNIPPAQSPRPVMPQPSAPPPVAPPQVPEGNMLFRPPVLGKANNMPPPPPPINNLPPPGSTPLKMKPLISPKMSFQKTEKTKFISIFESLGFVIPDLTEKGKNAVDKLPSTTEAFKFLKQVDGSTNLKQIYMMVYPSTVSPINFIEKAMAINEYDYFNFIGAGGFPKDADAAIRIGEILVALGYIDEAKIEQALLHQRRESKVLTAEEGEVAHYDAKETRKEENKGIKREMPLLGDILVDMKFLSYQQVVHGLKIQKWYRDILESIR